MKKSNYYMGMAFAAILATLSACGGGSTTDTGPLTHPTPVPGTGNVQVAFSRSIPAGYPFVINPVDVRVCLDGDCQETTVGATPPTLAFTDVVEGTKDVTVQCLTHCDQWSVGAVVPSVTVVTDITENLAVPLVIPGAATGTTATLQMTVTSGGAPVGASAATVVELNTGLLAGPIPTDANGTITISQLPLGQSFRFVIGGSGFINQEFLTTLVSPSTQQVTVLLDTGAPGDLMWVSGIVANVAQARDLSNFPVYLVDGNRNLVSVAGTCTPAALVASDCSNILPQGTAGCYTVTVSASGANAPVDVTLRVRDGSNSPASCP